MASDEEETTIGRFANNVSDFTNYLRELFDDCKDSGCQVVPDVLLDLGIQVIESYATRDLIESLIESSKDHWDHIHSKNEKYFDDNLDSVFSGLKMTNVGLFKKLLTAADEQGEFIVSMVDRENIWDYLHAFVKLSLQFIHEERVPMIRTTVDDNKQIMVDGDGREMRVPIYTRRYMEEIDLVKYFKLYRTSRRREEQESQNGTIRKIGTVDERISSDGNKQMVKIIGVEKRSSDDMVKIIEIVEFEEIDRTFIRRFAKEFYVNSKDQQVQLIQG
jgi:hypothetical protein